MTAKQAIDAALTMATSARGVKPPESAATATELAFHSVTRSVPDTTNPYIAPSRCIWLVKVNAPWGYSSPPASRHPHPFHPAPSFFALYDVNSGFMFEAGPQYAETTTTSPY